LGIQLVVFDVDGTLTKHSSVWWRLHEAFGTTVEGRKYFDQYFANEIDYNEWAALDAGLWTGQSVEKVMELVSATKLVRGAKETIDALRNNGIHTAILSGGLDLMANDIARRVGIEYVLTNKLLHQNGKLTGDVDVLVGWGEKVEEIKNITDHFGIPLDCTAFVGDGKNDVSVFSVVGLSIAFNPEHQEVADAALITVREDDLRSILPHILA
jgi:phosphoserine phosphatase